MRNLAPTTIILILGAVLMLGVLLTACSSWKDPSTVLVSKFETPPAISPLGEKFWYLNEDLVFVMEKKCSRVDRANCCCDYDSKKDKKDRESHNPCDELKESMGTIATVTITVPKGFVTDLASIPFPANLIFNKAGRYASAGIVHDYLYWKQPCGHGKQSRRIADQIIKEALKALDDNERRSMCKLDRPLSTGYQNRRFASRHGIKSGVLLGGWVAWKKNKARKETQNPDQGAVRYLKPGVDQDLLGLRWNEIQDHFGQEDPSDNSSADTTSSDLPEYCRGFFEKKRGDAWQYLEVPKKDHDSRTDQPVATETLRSSQGSPKRPAQ